jgi:uncharacterized protein (DUF302 family)
MATPIEFTYRREGSRTFAETLEAVESAVRAHGLAIINHHDLQATLAAKGFVIQPLVILDVAEDIEDPHPCKLHVYAEGDTVWVTAMRPTVLWSVIEPGADPLLERAEESMIAVVDAAAG